MQMSLLQTIENLKFALPMSRYSESKIPVDIQKLENYNERSEKATDVTEFPEDDDHIQPWYTENKCCTCMGEEWGLTPSEASIKISNIRMAPLGKPRREIQRGPEKGKRAARVRGVHGQRNNR